MPHWTHPLSTAQHHQSDTQISQSLRRRCYYLSASFFFDRSEAHRRCARGPGRCRSIPRGCLRCRARRRNPRAKHPAGVAYVESRAMEPLKALAWVSWESYCESSCSLDCDASGRRDGMKLESCLYRGVAYNVCSPDIALVQVEE